MSWAKIPGRFFVFPFSGSFYVELNVGFSLPLTTKRAFSQLTQVFGNANRGFCSNQVRKCDYMCVSSLLFMRIFYIHIEETRVEALKNL